jgi:NAD-dependent SIR2 family protein deacetylase
LDSAAIEQAAALTASGDALVIAAGAGKGVDSGLPDFRGNAGFWKAYPALASKGTAFTDIAVPAAFRASPHRAWGFYGHRVALCRQTRPHVGRSVTACSSGRRVLCLLPGCLRRPAAYGQTS